ncbi:MAG: SCO family protein, partial [Myxococcota bacterium]|nr:SCO family protein [Myxococcota bacterium]
MGVAPGAQRERTLEQPLGWIAFAAVALGMPTAALMAPSESELPSLGEVPEFSFSDRDGSVTQHTDLDGTPAVILVLPSPCEGACNTSLAQLSVAWDRLGGTSSGIRVVSLTDDPVRVSRAVPLERVDQWTLLNGIQPQMTDLLDAYGQMAPELDQTGGIFLVDRSGMVRSWAAAGVPLEPLIRDAERLMG